MARSWRTDGREGKFEFRDSVNRGVRERLEFFVAARDFNYHGAIGVSLNVSVTPGSAKTVHGSASHQERISNRCVSVVCVTFHLSGSPKAARDVEITLFYNSTCSIRSGYR